MSGWSVKIFYGSMVSLLPGSGYWLVLLGFFVYATLAPISGLKLGRRCAFGSKGFGHSLCMVIFEPSF